MRHPSTWSPWAVAVVAAVVILVVAVSLGLLFAWLVDLVGNNVG